MESPILQASNPYLPGIGVRVPIVQALPPNDLGPTALFSIFQALSRLFQTSRDYLLGIPDPRGLPCPYPIPLWVAKTTTQPDPTVGAVYLCLWTPSTIVPGT